jgi:hypothetical protein
MNSSGNRATKTNKRLTEIRTNATRVDDFNPGYQGISDVEEEEAFCRP